MKKHHLHIVSATTWGGGETYVFNLARHALEHGDDVTIITDSRYPAIGRRFQAITLPIEMPFSVARLAPNVLRVREVVREKKVSTINYHSGKVAFLAVMASLVSQTPCVSFKHNIIKAKNDAYHNFLTKHLAAIVCVSGAVKRAVLSGIPSQYQYKLHMIHPGVRLPDTVVKNNGGCFRIGYAGRIVPNKGVEVLLKAVQQLGSDFELFVAGQCDTDYGRELQSRYDDAHIHFLGEFHDLSRFYQSIDVLVVPSIVPEAFGLAICEAMSYELPVMTTTSGAQAEIIGDGVNGFLICPDDVEELKRTLKAVAQDPQLLRTVGQNARRRIESAFTMDHLYTKLNRLYDSL